MERQRSTKVIALTALIIAIVGVSIAFAAMSSTLTINGTAKMETASWDVKFDNLSSADLKGSAIEETEPTLSDTNIGDYRVKLTKPGDSVTYTFDVVNSGTLDAELGTFTKNNPQCEGLASGAAKTSDEGIVCGNLTYTLKYTAGDAVAANDTLNAGQTRNMTLTLSYNGSSLPTDDVEISGLDITMVYNQK